LESEGIPTTGISLVREHTEQMRLPRFLWVPFELGRPFGAPNAPDFQRRVLRSALELFEGHPGPVVLGDFPDEAPEPAQSGDEEASFACPVVFRPTEDGRPEMVRETLDEMARLAPWHEIYVERRGADAPAASGLTRDQVVGLLGQMAEGETGPVVESDKPSHESLRLGCDDLRTWYMEAAQGQPGRGSPRALSDWFWRDTALARLIGRTASALVEDPNPMLRVLARRALVPRQYFPDIMPGIDSSRWDSEGGSQ